MEQKLTRVANVIKDVTTADWKIRVEALRDLRGLVGEAPCYSIRALVPSLVKQIGDGRSIVMQEACETARAICFAYGAEPEFPAIADMLVKACMPIVPSSTKVMSDAAKSCLKQVVQATTRGFQAPFERFLQGAQAGPGKAACLRLECVKLVNMCLNEWDIDWMLRIGIANSVEVTIRKALRDADSEVRVASREAFKSFANKFPEDAKKSFKELEPEDRQRFQELFPALTQVPNPSMVVSSAAKRTPFHAPSKTIPTPSYHTVPRPPPPSTVRKPLQTIPLNVSTPGSTRVKKMKEERPQSVVAFPNMSSALGMSNNMQSEKKRVVTFRDRLARDFVDLLGRAESMEARTRMATAMKDIAEIFVTHAEDLQLSDFIQCESAIEMSLFGSDQRVTTAGLDALGTFVWALARCRHGTTHERDTIMDRVVAATFPIALNCTQLGDDQLAQAALRAVDTCAMFVSKNQLLNYTLHYAKAEKDENIMRYFAAVVDEPSEPLTDLSGESNVATAT